MNLFAPRGWTRQSASDLDPVAPDAPPTSFIPTTQATPHVSQMHPLAVTPTYMPSLSGSRRAFSLDDAYLPVQAHAQSLPTDIPLLPRDMLAHPHPSSSSSPGPLDVPQLGHVWWIFAVSRLVHRTPHAPPHPGAPSGNGPMPPNFWTTLWALRSLTSTLVSFHVSPLLLSPSPLYSCPHVSCTSPTRSPRTTAFLTKANATPFCTLMCSIPFICLTSFLRTTCLTLLTLIVTLPGASSTIACM